MLVVSDLLGRCETNGLINGTVVVAHVMGTMIMVAFGDAMILVGVPVHAIERVVVCVTPNVGGPLSFASFCCGSLCRSD